MSLLLGAAFAAALTLAAALPCAAATLTVNSIADDGPGTLRQALAAPNEGDTIEFDVPLPNTIALTSGQLEVDKSVTITGPGQENLTVDGQHLSRAFQIAEEKTVAVSGLTIANGNTPYTGGGIHNAGTLTLNDCMLKDNSATKGGGASSDPGGDSLNYNWEFVNTIQTGASPSFVAPAEPGIYPLVLTVVDEQGGGDTASTSVVVYDASAGFVTGGGWIDSPAGAYFADPDLAGKATFGFVSKYRKGATVPTGNTAFEFAAGDLHLRSSSYEWLLVTGRDYARFKGSGTINGMGDYKFMVWAGDDEPDTFSIRIWQEDEATGVETDIYDNGFDQPIGGGSIVIHTK